MPSTPDHDRPNAEALARKARSEAQLKKEKVKIAAVLPPIENTSEVTIRSRDEVVDRTLALTIVAVKGEGLDQKAVLSITKEFAASDFFSPNEHAFVFDEEPDQTTRVQFAWRYECLGVMLWALGFVPELGSPGNIVDAGKLVSLVANELGPKRLREEAKLRSPSELLDEADLILRYNWACVDARINGKPAPRGLDSGVVVERHYALNWLIGYMEQEWDDVSTDT